MGGKASCRIIRHDRYGFASFSTRGCGKRSAAPRDSPEPGNRHDRYKSPDSRRRTSFDITAAKFDPDLKDGPGGRLDRLDLETRSLLQVLFFVSHGVDLPPEHAASGSPR
jgi:hypothetical protein